MSKPKNDDVPLNEKERRLAGLLLQKLAIQACSNGHPPELEHNAKQKQALKGTMFDARIWGRRHLPHILERYECAEFKSNEAETTWGSNNLVMMLVDASKIPDMLMSQLRMSHGEMKEILRLYDLYDDDVLTGHLELYPELNKNISDACRIAEYPDVNAADWEADATDGDVNI